MYIAKEAVALVPQYDNAKSFYGKALEIKDYDNNTCELQSYSTIVGHMDFNTNTVTIYSTHSVTTLRHIKEWLKQHGFRADNKRQIMDDYGGNA